MKRFIPAIFIASSLTTAASGQSATLDTSTKEAYEASLLAIVEPLGEEGARDLTFHLLGLAAEAYEATQPKPDRLSTFQAFTDQPQVFLDAIKPYEGLTADQIMAIEP